MVRFSLNKLPKPQRIQLIGEFYDIIFSLKSRDEVRAFFRDLLNPDEITMFMRRVEIAALLWAGFTTEEIQGYTGAGRATITSVSKKLNQEDRNGYKIVIERLLEQRKKIIQKQKKITKLQKSEWERTKQRYPLAFLFSHILDEIRARQELKDPRLIKQAVRRTPSRRYVSMY